jgi:hypothetical protein
MDSAGVAIGDTDFEFLHRAIQGKADKVANGESQLKASEANIILDDSPAIRGTGHAIEALNMVFANNF